MIDLSVTLILPFQQTKCFIKKIKKKFYKKNLETTLIKNVSGYQITINLLTLLKRTQEQLQYTSKRSENEKVGVVIEHVKC